MRRNSNDLEHLFTDEATLLLGLNREQIIRRIQQGVLEGGKENGLWYVTRRSAKAFLATQAPEPAA